LEDLFENESFRAYAHYFLGTPTTIKDAAKLSGITRQTIMKQLGQIEPYVDQPKWSGRVKGRPLIISTKILTDFLAEKLKMSEEEKAALNEIVENARINPIIIRGNETIETALSKIILTIMLIGVLRYQMSSDDSKVSLAFVDSLFGEFLRSKILTEKKRKTKEKAEVETLKILAMYSSLAETEKEFVDYESAVKEYAKSEIRPELDKLDKIIFSLENSRLPIITYPRTWYELLGFTIEPSSHFAERVTKQRKAELAYKLKHGAREEKKIMKSIDKQFNRKVKK
jgi:hypothetical protein